MGKGLVSCNVTRNDDTKSMIQVTHTKMTLQIQWKNIIRKIDNLPFRITYPQKKILFCRRQRRFKLVCHVQVCFLWGILCLIIIHFVCKQGEFKQAAIYISWCVKRSPPRWDMARKYVFFFLKIYLPLSVHSWACISYHIKAISTLMQECIKRFWQFCF